MRTNGCYRRVGHVRQGGGEEHIQLWWVWIWPTIFMPSCSTFHINFSTIYTMWCSSHSIFSSSYTIILHKPKSTWFPCIFIPHNDYIY